MSTFDGVEQLPRLVGGKDRGLAALDDVLRPADGARRVHRKNLADDEPVEQHPDCGQVLLDRRRRARGLQFLDVGGDR